MSDGPFRSLPLGRYWQQAARCAGLSAYSDDEVQNRVETALLKDAKKDHLGDVVADIRIALGAGHQLDLLQDSTLLKLNDVRIKHAGSTMGSLLVDHVKAQVASGQTGELALEAGLVRTLLEKTSSSFRSMREICQRKGSADLASQMRARTMRLSSMRNLDKAAQKILIDGSKMKISPLSRRNGLDDGPPL